MVAYQPYHLRWRRITALAICTWLAVLSMENTEAAIAAEPHVFAHDSPHGVSAHHINRAEKLVDAEMARIVANEEESQKVAGKEAESAKDGDYGSAKWKNRVLANKPDAGEERRTAVEDASDAAADELLGKAKLQVDADESEEEPLVATTEAQKEIDASIEAARKEQEGVAKDLVKQHAASIDTRFELSANDVAAQRAQKSQKFADTALKIATVRKEEAGKMEQQAVAKKDEAHAMLNAAKASHTTVLAKAQDEVDSVHARFEADKKKSDDEAAARKASKEQAAAMSLKAEQLEQKEAAVKVATEAVQAAQALVENNEKQAHKSAEAEEHSEQAVRDAQKMKSRSKAEFEEELLEHNVSWKQLEVSMLTNPTLQAMRKESLQAAENVKALAAKVQGFHVLFKKASETLVAATRANHEHHSEETAHALQAAQEHLRAVQKQHAVATDTYENVRNALWETRDKLEHSALDTYLLNQQLKGKIGAKELKVLEEKSTIVLHAEHLTEQAKYHMDEVIEQKLKSDVVLRQSEPLLERAIANVQRLTDEVKELKRDLRMNE